MSPRQEGRGEEGGGERGRKEGVRKLPLRRRRWARPGGGEIHVRRPRSEDQGGGEVDQRGGEVDRGGGYGGEVEEQGAGGDVDQAPVAMVVRGLAGERWGRGVAARSARGVGRA